MCPYMSGKLSTGTRAVYCFVFVGLLPVLEAARLQSVTVPNTQ